MPPDETPDTVAPPPPGRPFEQLGVGVATHDGEQAPRAIASPGEIPSGVAAALAQQQRTLAAQHQAFVNLQQRAHRSFLDARSRSQQSLAEAFVGRTGSPIARRAAAPRPPAPSTWEEVLDPARDRWLDDHCPTYTIPAVPLMSMVDRLAAAALAGMPPGWKVIGMVGMQVERWLPVPGPVPLRADVKPDGDGAEVTLFAWRNAARAGLSRFEPVARGRVHLAATFPPPPSPLSPIEGQPAPDPYETGELFHGPAFKKLRSLVQNHLGSTAVLDARPGEVPHGALNQVLLDATTHAIPHADMYRWEPTVGPELVMFPHRIPRMTVHGPAPTQGTVRCEVRYGGKLSDRMSTFEVQIIADGSVWCAFELVEIALSKGPLGAVPHLDRRAFMRDRRFVEGMRLSACTGGVTTLAPREVHASNWPYGNLQRHFRHDDETTLVQAAAVKEHVAALAEVHPATVRSVPGGAISDALPITLWPVEAEGDDPVTVRSSGDPTIDLHHVRDYWRDYFAPMLVGETQWPVTDLYFGLIERFVRRIHVADPDAFAALRGRSILYLGNHQTGIESLLFSILVSCLSTTPTVTLAKSEHQHTWLGTLIQHCFSYPGITDPQVITYFDRSDPMSLPAIIGGLCDEMMTVGKSVMVHVEGTRSLSCRTPVIKMTSKFIDMALATGAPIVPVRFVGGVPVDPLEVRTEFPVGMGQQDIYLGAPIVPETFERLPYKERKPLVIDGINALGPPNATEEPFPGDADLSTRVERRVDRSGASSEHATVLEVLIDRVAALGDRVHPFVRALVEGDRQGRLVVDDSPRGRWLAELARRLYGERGAEIAIG